MTSWTETWQTMPPQRRKRWLLLVVAVGVLGAILWRARAVLGPYGFGLALAYLLAPVVRLIERGWRKLAGLHARLGFLARASRPVAIILTYLLLIAVLVGFFSLIVPLVVQQGESLWEQREAVWTYAYGVGEDILAQYRLLPPQVQGQIEEWTGNLVGMVGDVVQQAVEGTAVAISYTFSLVLAIFIIPFWTFYLLLDVRELGQALIQSIPGQFRPDLLKIAQLIDVDVSSYLRGQFIMASIIGTLSAVAFGIMGVRFALLLGLIAGIFEMIPNIGPILGAIPAVLVALTQDPGLALIVVIYAFAIQQFESAFIGPRILGKSVKLHPVLIMVALVIGSEIAGVLGLFLAPVVTAVLRDLFRYVYFRLDDPPSTPEEALQRVWQGGEFDINV